MSDIDHWKGDGMSANAFDRTALSNEAGKLLDTLLGHVNEIGRAQVPSPVLARESGLTQGAMVRARAELTRACLLRTEPGFSSSGLRGANVYVLNMSVIEPSSSEVPEGETGRTHAEEGVSAGHLVSGEVPAPSGRHRNERRPFWKKFFGGSSSS